jgi:hypothetical protein
MRLTLMVALIATHLASPANPARADDKVWINGLSRSKAFPEHEPFGAFSPRWAATMVSAGVRDPESLIQLWSRLPNDLHQWDCGQDSLGHPKRCLDETFHGSGEYTRSSVTAHFDTIVGVWHFIGFEFR